MVKEFSFPEIMENHYVRDNKERRSELLRRAKCGDATAASELYIRYSKAKVYTEEEIREFEKTYEF